MPRDFFKTFIEGLSDPMTTVAADGTSSAEFGGLVDTGSLVMNAALSGSLFGGFPDNKILLLAGETTVGKSFFALGIAKSFLERDPRARVVYYDSEAAITNQMLIDRGLPLDRVAKSEPVTLESFRNSCSNLLDRYAVLPQRFPLLIVLDSLSALPSVKEVTDITEDKNTKDMTKPGVIKGCFRVLRLKLSKCCVPMIVTNHTYVSVGAYVPTKVVAGGSGAQYASDSIVMLSKKKDRIEDEVVGNIIHVAMAKSRLSRENTKVDTRIAYHGGLDRYYGLLAIAEAGGVIKKVANKYEFPDGVKAFEKAILKSPEKFWTKEVLDAVEAVVAKQFRYAATEAPTEDEDDDEEAV